jgi:hypothetical protein
MSSTELSRPPRKRARLALAAALVAVGCSGGTGGGCGNSCGGAFRTKDDNGKPIKYTGTRLDNVAQLRVTTSGFTWLNAAHLNDVVGALNGDSSISQSFKAPDTASKLSFWYRVTCPTQTGHGYASAALHDNVEDTTATVLIQTCSSTGAWAQITPVSLKPKHTYTLFLSNHDGADVSTATYTDYDDVAVTTSPAPAKPIIANGGFETNGLESWEAAGTAELTSAAPHSGASSARVGKTSPGFSIPCIDAGTLLNACLGSTGFHFHVLAGDSALSGNLDTCKTEKTPLHLTFKDVSWALDPTHNVLKAHLVMHLQTGDIYVRTVEEHSTLCNGTSAIQARVVYNDELLGLPQKDTAADLNISFSTTPDGRLEFNFDDASLANVVANFQPAALVIDAHAGNDPAPPATASYNGDGCGSGSGTYSTMSSSTDLNCGGLLNALTLGCDPTAPNDQGGLCAIYQYIRGYLFDLIKNSFKAQILKVLRTQLDNMRCQRSTTSQGGATQCDAAHACPADDDGQALACDKNRGVCYPPAQGLGTDGYNCEPVQLGIAGTLDVDHLTQKVGFPPKSALNLFAGLGSKGSNGGAKVDANGLQLAVEAGTQPASDSNYIGVCVPPALPADPGTVPAMDFDDINNKPTTVGAYDFGFSLASAMLNRGFLDAYNAGMLCVAISNQTTAFISSGLFKTFLPSVGLVTGQKDVPMKILVRPTAPPFVRIGKNTTKKDASGNDVPDDPLITLSFRKMNLDFYALVDERQVRIFTLQADLLLPLNLRALSDPNAGTLQPVLGGLDTVLTNISALSPDGGPYSATVDMLAEDPGVVRDLLGAAVRLAQPLLAGVIKPVALPSMMSLKLAVRGIAGAVPMADLAADGYSHLAIWAQVGACGGTTSVICEEYTVKTQARVVRSFVPGTLKEVRDGARPELELELAALSARSGSHAQFSYRVDGSLWSPWLGSPRLVLRDPLFLVQGHHLIEVTAREAGDDLTADPNPVALDFFVSYESPEVSLVQRPDGAVITRAHSGSSPAEKLAFSYRIDGEQSWMQPGPARVFTDAELGGRGLWVSVSDEAGRATVAHFGDEQGPLARASVAGGCASPGASLWAILGLAALALVRRQRKGSISAG